MERFEVVVGNVGTIHRGNNRRTAEREFNAAVRDSKAGNGRSAGEPVTLCEDGEPIREYHPAALVGFNGDVYHVGDRVEIHPGTDLWMRGARFGVVVGTSCTRDDKVHVVLDKIPGKKWSGPADRFNPIRPIYS